MKKNLMIKKRFKGGGKLNVKQPISLVGLGTPKIGIYLVITLVSCSQGVFFIFYVQVLKKF